MAQTLTAVDGDRLDLLCWHPYGHLTLAVEPVLAANPSLAAKAYLLPAGVVTLPDLPAPAPATLKLW